MKKTEMGDCYDVHGKAIIEMPPEYGNTLLCHGVVWHAKTGWHGHCWLELNEDVVLDMSNGHQSIMRKEAYYAAGKVRDVRSYTAEQAMKMMSTKGTYGPWEES